WIFFELLQGSIKLLNGGPDVAHWAHIGGFLFGLIIMVAMGRGIAGGGQFLNEGRALLRRGWHAEGGRLAERGWSWEPHGPWRGPPMPAAARPQPAAATPDSLTPGRSAGIHPHRRYQAKPRRARTIP